MFGPSLELPCLGSKAPQFIFDGKLQIFSELSSKSLLSGALLLCIVVIGCYDYESVVVLGV